MILQSLTELYQAMAKKGKVPHYGFSSTRVAFMMSISPDGRLKYITPLKEEVKSGKTTRFVDQTREVPMHYVRSSNIRPQFLCDTSAYLLGLADGGAAATNEHFEASRAFHHEVLKTCANPVAEAVLAFLDTWNKDPQHPAILENPDVLKGGFIIIEVMGFGPACEDEVIRGAWLEFLRSSGGQEERRCLVTGELASTARIHLKIKGVRGAQSSGANLVSFNTESAQSYCKEAGLIAPVSEYASFAYATALNFLLSQRTSRCQIGDDTVVFWAEDDDEQASAAFFDFLNPTGTREDADKLRGLMRSIAMGYPVEGLALNTPCHILALAPNAARLSVRYYFRNSLGYFLKNISAHYERLRITGISEKGYFLTPAALLRETANLNERTPTASPLLGGAVMRAILQDTPYPEALFQAAMLRLRATQDNTERASGPIYKITPGRAAIVKACLMKKNLFPQEKEVLTEVLNKESNNKPYVLGRLFALLEEIQERGSPDINTTIKDKYFNAASSTPMVVFPNLIRLSSHHLNKIESQGSVVHYQKSIGELMDKLNVEDVPFPPQMNLKDQGLFFLGYYQQNQYRFTNKEEK